MCVCSCLVMGGFVLGSVGFEDDRDGKFSTFLTVGCRQWRWYPVRVVLCLRTIISNLS